MLKWGDISYRQGEGCGGRVSRGIKRADGARNDDGVTTGSVAKLLCPSCSVPGCFRRAFALALLACRSLAPNAGRRRSVPLLNQVPDTSFQASHLLHLGLLILPGFPPESI